MWDAEHRILVCNQRYRDIYGFSAEVVKAGATIREIFAHAEALNLRPGSTAEELYGAFRERISSQEPLVFLQEWGGGRTIEIAYEPLPDGSWVATYTDVSERKQAELELHSAEAEYRALFENAVVGIYRSSPDGRTVRANPALVRLNGYASEAELLATMGDIAAEWYVDPSRRDEFVQLMRKDGRVNDFVSEVYRHSTGERIWVSETAWIVRGSDDEPSWFEGTVVDATERKRAEARIAHLAQHDALTELPNRALFRQRLDQALAQMKRQAGRGRETSFAVLYLDLDRFKVVNDTLGHPVGDALLQEVARRIREAVRSEDTVARLGGDEFAILQVGLEQPYGASALAQRLVEIVSQPYAIDGHHVTVGTSIGIALAPSHGLEADQLAKGADFALYRAKAEGRNVHRFFASEMDAEVQAHRSLELDLQKALDRGEFELHYQPMLDLARRRIVGFEALLRWHHPTRGLLLPGEFIPVAEEARLIGPIGEWVLRQACAEAGTWPSHVHVAVNVSAVQFRFGNLVQSVALALADAGLAADRLELEITETVLLQEDDRVLASLAQLRELGVRIALDDFGTGYSSLSYLRRFAFDKIKIDRAFIGEITNPDTAAVVRAIIGLGARLGTMITVEGIETAEQLARMRAEGCSEAQGYLVGRPLPAQEASALIGSLHSATSD
jgi:diguanylate cyclase (GGDEF)-like protein/PAS domain S-box-containing protein